MPLPNRVKFVRADRDGADMIDPMMIEEAAHRIEPHVSRTLLLEAAPLSERHGAQDMPLHARHIVCARILCRQSGRAHAQKAETPIDDAVDDRAQPDARQCLGSDEAPDHERVDQAHDRRRRIGEQDGPALVEDAARGEGCG